MSTPQTSKTSPTMSQLHAGGYIIGGKNPQLVFSKHVETHEEHNLNEALEAIQRAVDFVQTNWLGEGKISEKQFDNFLSSLRKPMLDSRP